MKRCARCKLVKYCNQECQRKNWIIHKFECEPLIKCSPQIPTESVFLLHRVLLRSMFGDDVTVKEEFRGEIRSFADLVSHKDIVENDPKRVEEFCKVGRTLQIFRPDLELPNQTIMFEMFGKICVNSFSICDDEMQPLGVGVYLGPSAMDHSCQPNAVVVFEGYKMLVNRLPATPVDDELFISYIDQMNDVYTRRRMLQEQYYFMCHCPRCQDIVTNQFMLSSMCPGENCTEVTLQNADGSYQPCSKCGFNAFDDEYTRHVATQMQICHDTHKDLKEHFRMKRYEAVAEIAAHTMEHVTVLHPINIYRVRLQDMCMDACIELERWSEAIYWAEMSLPAYRKHYGEFNPLLAVHLTKLGKLLLHQEEFAKAAEHLKQALSVTCSTYGKPHSMYETVAGLLQQATVGAQLAAQTEEDAHAQATT